MQDEINASMSKIMEPDCCSFPGASLHVKMVPSKQFVSKLVVIILVAIIGSAKSDDSANLDCSGDHANKVSTDPDDIGFYFYPLRGNPTREQKIEFNDTESLSSSAFNKDADKTVILIAGFTDNRTIHMSLPILEAYLESNLNYNYIIVDWGRLSGNCLLPDLVTNYARMFEVYTTVVEQSIPIVVNRTTEFINFLNLNPAKVHIIGHSLGAHVSGRVGALYQTQHEGAKISRITGLDPAGPLFEPTDPSKTIDRTDASFVDIIHTAMGGAGEIAIDGHVDFFPNGGSIQPGCTPTNLTDLDLAGRVYASLDCDHQFAPTLYAASLKKKFPVSCRCLGLSLDLSLPLVNQVDLCLSTCFGRRSSPIFMGIDCPTT